VVRKPNPFQAEGPSVEEAVKDNPAQRGLPKVKDIAAMNLQF